MLDQIIRELTESKTTRSRTLQNGATITWMPALMQFSAHRFEDEIDEQERVTFQKFINKAGFVYGRPERSVAFDLNQAANRYTVTWHIQRGTYKNPRERKPVQLDLFAHP